MKITANAGFANRLRILLGYREVCRKFGVPLTFVWLENRFCGALDNAFVIDGVDIQHSISPPRDAPAIPGKVTFKDIVQIYGIDAKEKVVCNAYRQIQFDPAISLAAQVGWQAQLAVHARVTDLHKSTGLQLTPSDFFSQIEEREKIHPIFPLYLATDSQNLQVAFIKRYGSQNILTTARLDPDKFRQSSLRDAVTDLLASSLASQFLGTPGSSFSNSIQIFRRINNASMSEN